jgi:hypothetical protein
MLSNMLAARAMVSERRHRFESEAERHRLRRASRNVDSGHENVRRERHQVFRLDARHA